LLTQFPRHITVDYKEIFFKELGSIFGIAISSNDDYFITVSGDKSIKVWDFKERKIFYEIPDAHRGRCIKFAF